MYDFIASVEHAPDFIEPGMTKPRRPAEIAPPPGLRKTPTRNAIEALEGAEGTCAVALEPTPRREHREHDRGATHLTQLEERRLGAHPFLPYPEPGSARKIPKMRRPNS